MTTTTTETQIGTESETKDPNRVVEMKVREDGSLLIPIEVCQAYGLDPGNTVQIEPVLVGFTATPVVTDEEAEAFWGLNIWNELAEAEADIAAGRTTFYGSDEEFLEALESRSHADVRGE